MITKDLKKSLEAQPHVPATNVSRIVLSQLYTVKMVVIVKRSQAFVTLSILGVIEGPPAVIAGGKMCTREWWEVA